MCFGVARWSLGSARWSPGAARGLPGGYRARKESLESLRKGVFGPLAPRGGVWGGSFPILGGTRPSGVRKRVWG